MKYLFALLMTFAYAHDSEQWIANKQLHDPVTGSFCCGPSDCRVLNDDEVKEVAGGFAIAMRISKQYRTLYGDDVITETVPYARAMPFADDGHYHACVRWTNDDAALLPDIRCFITPPGST